MKMVIDEIRDYVKNKLESEGSGHDWFHIDRVTKYSKIIGESENADVFICEVAALVHDLVDDKLGDPENGMKEVNELLAHIEEKDRNHIIDIISSISFKGGNMPEVKSLEAKVVQDADRLDAIGAIGIARAFVYAGSKGDTIYNPEHKPREELTSDRYRKERSTAINHFYEKLFKLKDLMNTSKGKDLAINRHEYMESFLKQFYNEWNGNE